GRRVALPVEVRDATSGAAMYLVRAEAARAVLAYGDLDVAEVLPGRALCVLGFVRYHDGDLGAYREFGMGFVVRPPGAGRMPRRGVLSGLAGLRAHPPGAFVHWLPVDQGFTLAAGRAIWGFPKEMADIDLRLSSPYKRCVLRKDGRLVLDLLLKPGLPAPAPIRPLRLDAYTRLDGLTRRVPWTLRPRGVRVRPGGALIRLGNHPIAKELSELGLPRRALLTVTAAHAAFTFHPAEPAHPTPERHR
ncbi:acetoacetate decarboxylase family protein, partial [Sphaerisporangium rufum]|uniref:acetoacetate decarboxylase family protein n=1 Tax=Sphaerisporangium rufum TaxID=1381558 RepID=UPI0019500FCD